MTTNEKIDRLIDALATDFLAEYNKTKFTPGMLFDMPFSSPAFTGVVRAKYLGLLQTKKGPVVMVRYWHKGDRANWTQLSYPVEAFKAKFPNSTVIFVR